MDFVVEQSLHEVGLHKIAGCDEAGRGPLAGPVVAAAVMLPPNHKIDGLNDSKQLSAKNREELYRMILERAIDAQISMCMNQLIDKVNIYNATKACIRDTLMNFKVNPDIVVIDGSFTDFIGNHALPFPYQTQVKGDALSENVAAASILAKVYRDHWMTEIDSQYPQYGFAKHKGYGTAQHIKALTEFGPCPIHRLSFSVKGIKIGAM